MQGRDQEALSLFEQALTLDPSNREARAGLEVAQRKLALAVR